MRSWLVLAPLLACTPPASEATTASTSTGDAASSSTTTATTAEPTTTGTPCPTGQEHCPCALELACDADLACIFAVCVALDCTRGELDCACLPDATCGLELVCNSGNVCAPDGACPYTDDGACDVPEYCPEGSDVNDCCPTKPGVCEELGMGGDCPPGTDLIDCNYCIYTDDGECDEPDLCPPDSDTNDCCANLMDDVCDELGMGGMCPEGSDIWDCGYCPTPEDGVCDEVEDIGELCPPGSDAVDCCAHLKDGKCEEQGMGGTCPAGSDIWDCGYCPWADDDQCDEPEGTDLCGEGTDPKDCP